MFEALIGKSPQQRLSYHKQSFGKGQIVEKDDLSSRRSFAGGPCEGRMTSKRWRKPHGVAYQLHPTAEQWIKTRLVSVTGKPLSNAWRLIEYLCQKHTGPDVDGRSFTLCRRGLATVESLDLSEWQIRTTIKILVTTGLVAQISLNGDLYRKTSEGWRKSPIIYRLASGLLDLFRSFRPFHPVSKPYTEGDAFGRKANWSKPKVEKATPILATGKPIADDDPRNWRKFQFDDRLRARAIRALMLETIELTASAPTTPDTRSMAEKIAACPDRPAKPDSFVPLGRFFDDRSTVQRRGVALDDDRLSQALARVRF